MTVIVVVMMMMMVVMAMSMATYHSGSRIKYNLDQKGEKVVIARHHDGSRAIEGTGVAVASLPIEQDAAYW